MNINGIDYVRLSDLERAKEEIMDLRAALEGKGFDTLPMIPVEVINHYIALIPNGVHPEYKPDPGTGAGHLRWMLDELLEKPMPAGKANRWLGFIQGCLICRGVTTVQAERDFTRSFFAGEGNASVQEPFPQPERKDGGEPCGECRIQPEETCDVCGAKGELDVCPDCGREKAHSAGDAAAGKCPKDWAPRDPMAEFDCIKHKNEALRGTLPPEWPPTKKAIWCAVTDAELNKGGYIDAYELTDRIYEEVNEVSEVYQAKVDNATLHRTISMTVDNAARAAYRVCAESRHIKLGDAVREAVEALKPAGGPASPSTEKQFIDDIAGTLYRMGMGASRGWCQNQSYALMSAISKHVVPAQWFVASEERLAKAEARADELFDEARNWKLKAEANQHAKDTADQLHRRAQIAEGLYEAVKLELEGWVNILGKPSRETRVGDGLMRHALRRMVRLQRRAGEKLAENGFELYGWVIPRANRYKRGSRSPVLLTAEVYGEESAAAEADIHDLGYFPVYRLTPRKKVTPDA